MRASMRSSYLVAAAACAGIASAASPEQWRSRSIYQVITDRFSRPDNSTDAPCDVEDRIYCGGNYKGLIKNLDYIQGMGFDSVWISPVTKQIEGETGYGEAYHGYWQMDIYGTNDNFGTADDLKDLSDALHERDMFLMVDIVVNHNVWDGPGESVDYSQFNPFNTEDKYHTYCLIEDYEDQDQVENCWLGDTTLPLPDLNTNDESVKNEYNSWINGLVSNYSIDGLRIDTVKHVNQDFFPAFNEAAGVYCVGEVLDGDPDYTCDYQNVLDGLLNYPIYYPLLEAFKSTNGDLNGLAQGIKDVQNACNDVTILGSFSESHDIPRFASYTQDMALAKNVLAFTILGDGIPVVYNGQEQHYSGGEDPKNREAVWLSGFDTQSPLYQHIAKLNKVRTAAGNPAAANTVISTEDGVIALRKGDIVTVLTNAGADGGDSTVTIDSGYEAGEVTDVLTCETATVEDGGSLSVEMSQGLPRVYAPSNATTGSGLC